jgi:lysophospholipase L1-like esterase
VSRAARAPAARRAAALLCAAALGCSSTREQPTPPTLDLAPARPSRATALAAPPDMPVPPPLPPGAAAPPAPTALPVREADRPYAHFFAALRALEQQRRTDHVRIAWLGDSHGAADFWSGALRTALQRRFGDGGIGFVHVGYSGYRHDRAKVAVDGKWRMRPRRPAATVPTDDGAFGLGGILFSAQRGLARAQITTTEAPGTRLSWDLCFRLSAPTDELWVSLTGAPSTALRPAAGDPLGELRHVKLTSGGAATLSIAPSGAPELCGVVVETDPAVRPGVVLDTLGINGARLATPLAWSELPWAAELALRAPDLVVLEYGTNESGDLTVSPALYRKHMAGLLGRVRRARPDADCLVLAPTDRKDTAERTPLVRDALHDAALELGCGFWDTYEAMGGRGSIDAWRAERPPRALRDGVHLTIRGYRELGGKLAEDLLQRYRP